MAKCAHSKSDMTPCVIRDGAICFGMDWKDDPVCVGCGRSPGEMGVEKPTGWLHIIADFYKQNPSAKKHRI